MKLTEEEVEKIQIVLQEVIEDLELHPIESKRIRAGILRKASKFIKEVAK
jgi:hypothetical protein